ncbi:hypothetical protein PMG71_12540 [Roseofilum sp. BLCC_M154]|uniref:Uncharacterized protein n=1 Tax=Roseofilum acuticapitatum BLCC-M154 TaxID=3022444 RepID=A0ABT7ATN8_9CYAN|nr:hypothetical protein [Roseofilum acuticapitatum]MDJ1170259.1 hypothetical protein [Roseofilum acuticapitatum BLCC-M154]
MLHSLKVFACGGCVQSVSTKLTISVSRLLTECPTTGVSPAFKVNVASPLL